jgi:hypothetical protein
MDERAPTIQREWFRAMFQFAGRGFVVADRELKLERSPPKKRGQRMGMLRRAGGVLDESHFS